jgi:hypothetical protein
MDLRERQGMSGVLTIEVVDDQGRTLDTRRVNNLITRRGKEMLANLLMGKEVVPSKWTIAVGTGTDAVQVADTGLKAFAAEAEDPAPKVEVIETGGQLQVRATVTATLPAPTGTTVQALTEAGIQITQGANQKSLFNRVRFEQVNRGPNMVMKLTWEITF